MSFDDLQFEKDYEQEAMMIWELIKIAKQGKQVRILGKGNSMRPLLRDGMDYAFLEDIKDKKTLKKGDVVFYYYNGHFVLHRVYKVLEDGAQMLGDGNNLVEEMVPWKHIFLKAVKIERNGKVISMNSWYLKCYGTVWMWLRPVRGFIRRGLRWIKRIMHVKGRSVLL
ncbi:MAG: S24/S26 family peptidase [Lachnospiraceae bacterium]|jgi:hypothetical protein|nr:S24/S26 family peptidase [Lachnospiraceae bacterium]